MLINCKESAVRTSQLRDRQLKGMRKVELWYHLLICQFCRIYGKQISMLGKLSRLMGEASGSPTTPVEGLEGTKLPEDAKARIKNRLSTN
jgi:hypothetical protein